MIDQKYEQNGRIWTRKEQVANREKSDVCVEHANNCVSQALKVTTVAIVTRLRQLKPQNRPRNDFSTVYSDVLSDARDGGGTDRARQTDVSIAQVRAKSELRGGT